MEALILFSYAELMSAADLVVLDVGVRDKQGLVDPFKMLRTLVVILEAHHHLVLLG